MPDSAAALALPPTARRWVPVAVRVISTYIATTMTAVTTTGIGMPSNVPNPNRSPKALGMPETGTPPVSASATPKPIDCTPSVMMNGDTLPSAMPRPLTRPTAEPAAKPAPHPSSTAQAADPPSAPIVLITDAETTDVNATTVPTERSNPPVAKANI